MAVFGYVTNFGCKVNFMQTINGLYSIIDVNGQLIKQQYFNNSEQVFINFSNLHSGMYILVVQSEDGDILRKKIVK